jgi:pimeloyl-ACP methyl ester carboxylesterase
VTGRTGYLRVNGADLYSEVIGAGDPLLLLHGGFCSLESLRPHADELAQSFTVAAFERPGHGRSADVPGPFSYIDGATDAAAYLDGAGIDRAHIVGYSDGAIIGLLLALRHPERVRSLVAISGNLDPNAFTWSIDHVRRAGEPVAATAPETATGAGTETGAAETKPGEAAETPTAAPAPAETGTTAAAEPDRERRLYDALSPDGPEHAQVVLAKLRELWTTQPQIAPAELAGITAPTLVMSGDRDTIRVDHSQLIASSIPGARLCIVPGSTHALVDEKPELVQAVLRDFYASLGTGPGFARR